MRTLEMSLQDLLSKNLISQETYNMKLSKHDTSMESNTNGAAPAARMGAAA
jgi:hypothetical protein